MPGQARARWILACRGHTCADLRGREGISHYGGDKQAAESRTTELCQGLYRCERRADGGDVHDAEAQKSRLGRGAGPVWHAPTNVTASEQPHPHIYPDEYGHTDGHDCPRGDAGHAHRHEHPDAHANRHEHAGDSHADSW